MIGYFTTNREPSATRDFHGKLLAGASRHARWENKTYTEGGEASKSKPVLTVGGEPFDFSREAKLALDRALKYEADLRAITLH
jgi:hypothetical protein